jgi:hypothetical protein
MRLEDVAGASEPVSAPVADALTAGRDSFPSPRLTERYTFTEMDAQAEAYDQYRYGGATDAA